MRYKVSVIITNYNQEKYIEQAIESVLGQNLKEVQIIIVDDGSTDYSSNISQDYANRYENVFYVRQDNKGVSSARNLGISKAEAEYIAFLDADDYVTKDGYEQLYNLCKKENADTAIGNIICFNEEKQWELPYMKKLFYKNGNIVRQIKLNPELHLTPSVNNKLFKRSLIKEKSISFDESIRVGEDLLFTQKSLFLSYRTIIFDVDVLNYRVVKENEESLSKKISIDYFEQLLLVQKKLKNLYEELDIVHFFKYIEKRQLKFFIDSVFSKGIYLSKMELKDLIRIGNIFSSGILNVEIFEDLINKDKLLLQFIVQNKYDDVVNLLRIISEKSVNKELVVERAGIYDYLYRYFPKEKNSLAVKELIAVHRIEVFRFHEGILTIGGYAYIEGISSEIVQKELVFKNGKDKKIIQLKDNLRTDITYIKSNNTIDYNNSGFETLHINLKEEIGEGTWEVSIRLLCNEVIVLEQKVEVILAQLRNHFKATVLNSVGYLPTFKNGKYLSFSIKKLNLMSKIKIKLGQMKRNVKYDLGFLLNKDYRTFFVIAFYKLFQTFFRKKNIWVIGERKDTAQDNSYHLFKYIRENHPSINIHYVIDESSNDVKNIKGYGNIISFNSFKHSLYLLVSSKTLNSYAEVPNMHTDSYRKILKYYPEWQQNERIFLQHGVIGVSRVNHTLHKNRTNYSLFVVSSEFEKEHVVKEFGYKENEVIVTGLARWDALEDTSTGTEVLLMPTWRSWIKSEQQLLNSDYLKNYLTLLHSKSLHHILERKNLTLTFYPHYQIQKLLGELPEFHERITVVRQGEETVQSLLKRHSILITDYSTVSFDFAYMEKPVLFYQFDYDEFYSEHYNEGPIDHKKELFGPVVDDMDMLLNELSNQCDKKLNKQYIPWKMRYIAPIKQHCKKVYEEILEKDSF